MNQNSKNKVILDTSFLIRAAEGFYNKGGHNIIDAEFSPTAWDRIIHDYVIDEFFRIENERAKRADFYKNSKIYTMASSHEIFLKEFNFGTAKTCLEKNERIESNIIPFLKGQHWDQKKLETEHNTNKKQRETARERFYVELVGKDFNSNTILSLQLLKDNLYQLINNGYQIVLPFGENVTIYIKKASFELIHPLGNREIFKREVINFEKEMPSLYHFLLLEQLITRLQKPENKDEFKVKLPDLNSHVKIEFNTLADSQISLSGLHYCDVFATFDKAQAQLIKFLFPEHVNKTKLYKENKDQTTYNSVDLEKL